MLPSTVERIQRCHLSQWQICHINPTKGRNTEILVKQSLERSLIAQGLTGTVCLNDTREKRTKPDIYLDSCGRSLSLDCRHWTGTESRHGKVYPTRELYGYARGVPSLVTYLQDTRRFLFMAWELAIIDTADGHTERRLFCVPGLWLQDQFNHQTGISIEDIAGAAWPGFSKGKDLLYQINVCGLIETADCYGRR